MPVSNESFNIKWLNVPISVCNLFTFMVKMGVQIFKDSLKESGIES